IWTRLPRRQPMNEPGNDVFSGAALAGDKHWNVGGGYFAQSRTDRLHDFRVAKNDVVRGDLAERLCQRTYRKCSHKTKCPQCGQCQTACTKSAPQAPNRGRAPSELEP